MLLSPLIPWLELLVWAYRGAASHTSSEDHIGSVQRYAKWPVKVFRSQGKSDIYEQETCRGG